MIAQNFLNKYNTVHSTTVKSEMPQINFLNDEQKSLKTLKEKHCSLNDNHTPELLAFVSSARSIGIDKHIVENYIYNNIPIAPDSSKANTNNLKKMITDSYNRYPVGNFAKNVTTQNAVSKVISYKTDFSKEDCNAFFDKYNQYRVTTASNYPTPNPILSINGESIATAGNIMTVSGLQKSGKSSLCNIILSGCISDTTDGIPPEIKIIPSDGKAIIHFDTEQAKHRHLSNLKYSILKRSNKVEAPEYFYSYNIRGMEIQAAIEMLNELFFAANQKHGGIHLALIDGIADFVSSVNDEEKSIAIIRHLGYLATEYNTLLIVVVHRNPNDSKVRGHLGSELLRKSESVLAVKKENDCSYIDPEELRTAHKNDIPKYLFQYDKEKGYHCYTGTIKKETSLGKLELLKNFADTKLEQGKEYPRKEILELVCDAMGVKSDMAQKYIAQMSENQMIVAVKGKKGFWKNVGNADPFAVEENTLPFE